MAARLGLVIGLNGAALLEVLRASCTYVGLALLLAALCIRCLYFRWYRTQAIHVLEGGVRLLRWHTRTDLREEPWPRPSGSYPRPGAEVIVYYHARHPHRWTLIAPYRYARVLAGVGLVLTGIGVLLPFLPR